jgi:16S rRNA C967 or C1407 C5-methylase (RsmB/RsmF family)
MVYTVRGQKKYLSNGNSITNSLSRGMEKVSNLLIKLSRQILETPDEREALIEALTHPQAFYPCILWCQDKPNDSPFSTISPLDWQPDFVDRLELNTQPGKDPRHNRGEFYCLDFSSVFAASSLLVIKKPIKVIFDMCAAPGGKSVFAWRLFHPQHAIANEVIGKRLGMLKSNFDRCQIKPSSIFNADPSIVAAQFAGTSDLVLVDAPCSGQSLLAKGMKAPGCFHPATINQNANRQKRIIANAANIVAPNSYLAYTTCTYATAENEGVGEWFVKKFPQFKPIVIPHLADYRSRLTDLPCYRLFPQSKLGAGAFTMLFQNTTDGDRVYLPADLSNLRGFVRSNSN